MALPPDRSEINEEFVNYLRDFLAGKNPDNLWSICVFFPDQECRMYVTKGHTIKPGDWSSKQMDVELNRFDILASVFYKQNPQCQWKFKNGQHWVVCT